MSKPTISNFLWQTMQCSMMIYWLGMAVQLRLTGVKSDDFYPVFNMFCVFIAWMPLNISTINAWKPGSHCSQKKSKNATFNFLDFFFPFFLFFFQTAVDRVKMIFQSPNKGLICFKHYKFLIFDEKQLPKNFYSTYLQISLVPCS